MSKDVENAEEGEGLGEPGAGRSNNSNATSDELHQTVTHSQNSQLDHSK